MSNLKEEIKNLIIKKRPNLSEQSIRTYTSLLKGIYSNVFPNKNFDEENFNEVHKILHYIHEIPVNRRKTTLSALVIITNNDAYRKVMLFTSPPFHTLQKVSFHKSGRYRMCK